MLKKGKDDFPEFKRILGIDEVGYGSAAGPLVLCGVILPDNLESELFIDSKKLSDSKKQKAFELLDGKCEYFIAHASVKYINKFGITEAIKKCVDDITAFFYNNYDLILMDGINWYGDLSLNYKCIPKGDNTYQEIACASIIAKIKRDEYMNKLNIHSPGYNFDSNKGYLTEKHREALIKLGITSFHRTQYVDTWLRKKI